MYKISIFASKMPIPIQIFVHTWIVIEHKDKIDRFDVFGFTVNGSWDRVGRLYKNYHPPHMGCPMFSVGSYRFLQSKFQWSVDKLYELSSDTYPKVESLYNLLKNNPEDFPYLSNYHLLPGPNSNTFTQWVLDYVSPTTLDLPWTAVGRNYKRLN
jgi:hypothetical protein